MTNIKRCLKICLLLIVFSSSFSWLAAADGSVNCLREDRRGRCQLTVTAPGSNSQKNSSANDGGRQEAYSGGRASPRTCTGAGGATVPCSTSEGNWNGGRQCYASEVTSVSPFSAAVWGEFRGSRIMRCMLGGSGVAGYLLPPAAAAAAGGAAPPPPPDPGQLARTAVEFMDLHSISLGTSPSTTQNSPGQFGYVGWNAWMWVDDPGANSWGPITQSASEGGYTVTATANVSEVVWDMGNGDSVTCGRGTPRPAAMTTNEPSPDCGYVYTRDGDYTITATTHWNIEWTGMGAAGTIDMELQRSGDVRIAEVQVVNVAPRNP